MLHAIGLRDSPICTTGPTANGDCILTLQWNNRVSGPPKQPSCHKSLRQPRFVVALLGVTAISAECNERNFVLFVYCHELVILFLE